MVKAPRRGYRAGRDEFLSEREIVDSTTWRLNGIAIAETGQVLFLTEATGSRGDKARYRAQRVIRECSNSKSHRGSNPQ